MTYKNKEVQCRMMICNEKMALSGNLQHFDKKPNLLSGALNRNIAHNKIDLFAHLNDKWFQK